VTDVECQKLSEEGISRAIADAMAIRTVKSTIVPWLEMV
jgi:hypothetical protein